MNRLSLLILAAALTGCSAEYYAKKGREALDAHQLAEAERLYRSALDKEPTQPDALSGLGWTYQIAGEKDAAMGAFDRCLSALPQDVTCMRGKASVLLAQGNPGAAGELLVKAHGIAPEDPGVESSVALLNMAQGDLDGAAQRYGALVQRFPDMAEYRLGYAETLLRQKKAEASIAAVDDALKLEGTPVRFVTMLYLLKARALVAATSGRVDPKDCANTAPPVLAWLDAADAALASARATGVETDADAVARLVAKRRGGVEDRCPGLHAADAGTLPTLAAPPAAGATTDEAPAEEAPVDQSAPPEGSTPG